MRYLLFSFYCFANVLSANLTITLFVPQILGTMQFARHAHIPNGDWTTYQVQFATAVDFVDCARAVAEAKSQVLYHRARMVDALVDVFEQQFPPDSVADDDTDGVLAPVSEPGVAVSTADAAVSAAVHTAVAVVSVVGPGGSQDDLF